VDRVKIFAVELREVPCCNASTAPKLSVSDTTQGENNMAIIANTQAAAQLGSSMGMRMSTDLPKCPSAGDTKSSQISTEMQTFLSAAHTEITTYNKSVDALREGCTAAPKAVDTTDRAGAGIVNNSTGGIFTV
jgi:hypothetical protein